MTLKIAIARIRMNEAVQVIEGLIGFFLLGLMFGLGVHYADTVWGWL